MAPSASAACASTRPLFFSHSASTFSPAGAGSCLSTVSMFGYRLENGRLTVPVKVAIVASWRPHLRLSFHVLLWAIPVFPTASCAHRHVWRGFCPPACCVLQSTHPIISHLFCAPRYLIEQGGGVCLSVSGGLGRLLCWTWPLRWDVACGGGWVAVARC